MFGEEDATISNKVNGKIIAVYHDVGDRVAPGEPLAQLLKNDYLLDLNQKRAALLETLAKLGLNELPALEFGDALSYLLTGWGQSHTEGRYTNQLILEFKKIAGSPPEGGFVWSQLHSLICRKAFHAMVEKARLIGTPGFR